MRRHSRRLSHLQDAHHEIDVIIRSEEPGDESAIAAVHVAAFPTAAESRLVDALRAGRHLAVSLVAIVNHLVAGHIAFSPVTVDGATGGLGLAPVAVLPAFRRRGIAARLVREGLARSVALGYGFAVVLGEPHYYSRFGFRRAADWGLHDEYGGGDAFQALELRSGSIPVGAGRVQYGPEFARLTDVSAP